MKKLLKYSLYVFLGFLLIGVLVIGSFIYRVRYGLPFYESGLPNDGRTFYSAMGHTGGSFSEKEYLEVLERGIKWAGKINGNCQ